MKSEKLQDSLTPAINFLQNPNQSPNQMKTRWNLIDRIPPKNPLIQLPRHLKQSPQESNISNQ